MKIQLILVAAAVLQTGLAFADAGAPPPRAVVCHWRATQQSGIPVRICLTQRQWAQRVAYTQQTIREYQARSFVHP